MQPNSLGVYDLLGNVWEWTADGYDPEAYAAHPRHNPMTLSDKGERVIRGASHRSGWQEVRCSSRSSYSAHEGLPHIGLRLLAVREAR